MDRRAFIRYLIPVGAFYLQRSPAEAAEYLNSPDSLGIMTVKSHSDGFEREELFRQILCEASDKCPSIMAGTVSGIISRVAPDFLEGLFKRSPCVRKLRYIGYACFEPDCSREDEESFFKVGEIYESIDFNGATYTVKGHGQGTRLIGGAYFDRVS